jgi:hypothetical protein
MAITHATLSSEPGLIGGPEWDADHVIDGPIDLPAAASEPAAAPAGFGRLYARSIGGRVMPKWIGPAGVDYPLQPHLGQTNVTVWRGGNTTAIATTLSTQGPAAYVGVASAVQTPGLNTTSILGQSQRSRLLTSTTAGNIVSLRSGNILRAAMGNGYQLISRFALATMNAAQRVFMGLWNGGANPTNLDWTTDTGTARIGLVANSASGNWRLAHNAVGAAPTLIDLGASFPINTTGLIELALFCGPGATSVAYVVRNLSTGAVASGTLSTNLPPAATFLGPMVMMTNNTAAAAVAIDVVSVYLETDF